MNEAEFQAILFNRVRTEFSWLPDGIELEHHLKLRLGHHRVVIDGKGKTKDALRGRFDVLIKWQGKPLLVVELKAPDVPVETDDIGQALSYGRLHEPLVPLSAVTNGSTTILRRTYDASEVDDDSLEGSRLSRWLSSTAAIAGGEVDAAIQTLLGRSRQVWNSVSLNLNNQTMSAWVGSPRRLDAPIVENFQVPRTASLAITDNLAAGARIVAVHGPPMCGVTNVLAQVPRQVPDELCLLLDVHSNSDPLRAVANHLSRILSASITKNDVRGWLNKSSGLSEVVLIVDGVPTSELNELTELALAGCLKLVVGCNTDQFAEAAHADHRNQKTAFGRHATEVKVSGLSDSEFQAAADIVERDFSAIFMNGTQFTPELREPRTLRLAVATLPPASLTQSDDQSFAMTPAVFGPRHLRAFTSTILASPKLKHDYSKLADAFLEEAALGGTDPDWLGATYGKPSLDPDTAEERLGSARLERLEKAGLIAWFDASSLGTRLLISQEELLTAQISTQWAKRLSQTTNAAAELTALLALTDAVPNGDVALAKAILDSSGRNQRVLGAALVRLHGDKPTTHRLKEGSVIEMLSKDGPIRLHFGEGMDEEALGNSQAWLVLSHLLTFPMEDVSQSDLVNLNLFYELGQLPHLLYRPKPRAFRDVPAFHYHDVDGLGSFPCVNDGFIEPLTQSLWEFSNAVPGSLTRLARVACDEQHPHLAWRITVAAVAAENSDDKRVRADADQALKTIRPFMHFAFTHGQDVDSDSHEADPLPKDSASE